ncbi:signal transducing histidine kinase [Halosimplex carlsbadense 2-9-1]|uniref:histidine kinase n=1 Tax=Halosimplex carlsbadense 2-9-1 TaxID=797114 RepID=M0CKE8_9EURY|nr:PAS domain-containing sensor histidine kinase [Halosimplex carlsbadense]ELZ23760.1 signal transducing histidine kinase [Halosimplex carlsbadense 2-9-1]
MADNVLVVSTDRADASALTGALDRAEVAASVDSVGSLAELFEALCYDVVNCLVVPGEGAPVAPRHLERGVRALYPNLPVVLVGADEHREDGPGADGGRTVRVETADVSDAETVAAVAAALDADVESAAGRPPSRAETLLLSMVEGFPMHLYAKDEAARHALATGATVDLTDVIGRTDLALTDGPPDHHERAHADDRRVIETGEPVVETAEYTASDDDEYALTTKVPWYDDDGEVIGLVGITRDISERKRHERELRRRNERLAKVALVAAHELRNELQVASGRLEAVPDDTPHVDVVAESHRRLAATVDDIVRLATRERVEIDQRTVWLSTVAREVWASREAPGATLVVEDDARIRADLESLRICFEILLSNAVDHGGPDVTVTVRGTEGGFAVEDDGPGIDAEPTDRVFDAGFAASGDGDGFGLYVAQRIAADHGWTLTAENRDEGGARFGFSGVDGPEPE